MGSDTLQIDRQYWDLPADYDPRARQFPETKERKKRFQRLPELTTLTQFGGNMTTRFEACVHGLVQGVFFRHFTQRQAEALNLSGIVENQPNGTVRVIAEGEREPLEQLLKWLEHGPELASVNRVDVDWGKPSGSYSGFEILR